jgi:hypothetical protein
MRNLPTLSEIAGDARLLNGLDYEALMALLSEADEAIKQPTYVKKAIGNLLDDRLEGRIAEAYAAKGEDTGVVHISLSDEISADVTRTKRVAWDQAHLKQAVAQIAEGGDDPSEFVDVTYSVPEAKYKAWPSFVRKLFEAGRTVTPGNAAIKLVANQKEAA